MFGPISMDDAAHAARFVGEKHMRDNGRTVLIDEDYWAGKRALRRFRFFVPAEQHGWMDRTQDDLLENTNVTNGDISDFLWGVIEREYREAIAAAAGEKVMG